MHLILSFNLFLTFYYCFMILIYLFNKQKTFLSCLFLLLPFENVYFQTIFLCNLRIAMLEGTLPTLSAMVFCSNGYFWKAYSYTWDTGLGGLEKEPEICIFIGFADFDENDPRLHLRPIQVRIEFSTLFSSDDDCSVFLQIRHIFLVFQLYLMPFFPIKKGKIVQCLNLIVLCLNLSLF